MSKEHISKSELETDSFLESLGNIAEFYKKNKLGVQWAAIGIVAVIALSLFISRYMASQEHKTLLAYENAKTELGLTEFIAQHGKSEFVPLALFQKGNMLYDKEDYTGAMDAFNQVINDYKKHSLASFSMLSLGYCQLALGQNDEAVKTFKSVIETYPESPLISDAKLNLARTLLNSSQYEQAQQVIDEFLEAEPNSYLADDAKKMLPEIKRNL